jgi:UDP:flavonoid glycosyltransferase YjiC (YdhE family)
LTHHYLGPVLWSPETSLPSWWDRLPAHRPCVYLTLGSSGPANRLPRIVDALASLPITLLVATAGRAAPAAQHAKVHVAEFLPGSVAARRADLVVCNGGSPTAYQALAEGVPVLGIASNLDQHLAMHYIARAGAGRLLRSEHASGERLRAVTQQMLASPSYRRAAGSVAQEFACWSAADRFRALVAGWLGTSPKNKGERDALLACTSSHSEVNR